MAYFFIGIILVTIITGFKTDDTDKSFWERSGMTLYIDHKTGLQYLSSPAGLFRSPALIPRLDENGKHMKASDDR